VIAAVSIKPFDRVFGSCFSIAFSAKKKSPAIDRLWGILLEDESFAEFRP